MLTNTTAYELHLLLKKAIEEIRQSCNAAEISHLRMDIEVSGRITGDLLLQYKFGENYGGGDSTSSHNLKAAFTEFLRRKGWSAENQAALLTYSGEEKTNKEDDEIPF